MSRPYCSKVTKVKAKIRSITAEIDNLVSKRAAKEEELIKLQKEDEDIEFYLELQRGLDDIRAKEWVIAQQKACCPCIKYRESCCPPCCSSTDETRLSFECWGKLCLGYKINDLSSVPNLCVDCGLRHRRGWVEDDEFEKIIKARYDPKTETCVFYRKRLGNNESTYKIINGMLMRPATREDMYVGAIVYHLYSEEGCAKSCEDNAWGCVILESFPEGHESYCWSRRTKADKDVNSIRGPFGNKCWVRPGRDAYVPITGCPYRDCR